jgi:hypothetical protein
MPYFFLFDDLPAERPVGPLHGSYMPAKATLRVSARSDADEPSAGWLRRLFAFKAFRNMPESSQSAVIAIAQILREAGFLAVECEYDGGNDEGFASLDSATTADTSCSPPEVINRLRGTSLGSPEFDPYQTLPKLDPDKRNAVQERRSQMSEGERIRDWLDSFVQDISTVLLGEGYGTGEYAMVGRFRLDLQTGALVDLPLEPPPDFRNSGAFSLDDYYPDEGQA